MDETSFAELKQSPHNWDRTLHARLLDHLTKDHAKLVVSDIVFADPGTPRPNEDLVQAIKSNGRVVLASVQVPKTGIMMDSVGLEQSLPEFREAAVGSGVAGVVEERTSIIRRHLPNGELGPSLSWVALTNLIRR